MWKIFIKYTVVYLLLVLIVGAIHFGIAKAYNLSDTPATVYKIYIILSIITLMILQAGFLVKVKNPDFVGFTFMGGMIAKMGIVLALVVVNAEIKSNVLHLLSAYFVILFIEVLVFLRLLKLDLKKF